MKNAKLSQLLKKITGKLTYRQSVILAAVLCLLLAALIIFLPTGGDQQKAQNEPVEQPKAETEKIITAAIDIPARTFIREDMLKTTEVEKSMVPEGAVTEMNTLIGKPSSTMIMQGDVITDKKYFKDLKLAGFSGLIPADCRAVSVAISDITAVAGFLNPGDYVDVMLVNSDDNGTSGEIILQNVLLLAINKNGNVPGSDPPAPKQEEAKKDDGGGEGEKKEQQQGGVNASGEEMKIATLALTPEEALELAARSQKGRIYLSLRPFKPTDTFVMNTEYKEAGAIAAANPQPAAPAAPSTVYVYAPSQSEAAPKETAPPAPPAQTIEVIRGVEKSTVGVK